MGGGQNCRGSRGPYLRRSESRQLRRTLGGDPSWNMSRNERWFKCGPPRRAPCRKSAGSFSRHGAGRSCGEP
jgi:hypothetical protein